MKPPGNVDFQSQVAGLAAGALDLITRGEAPRPEPPEEPDPASFGPLHTAASVLASFDRSQLKPAAMPATPADGEDILDVLADSTPVRDRSGRPRWQLLAQVRRDVLQQLGSREAIEHALDANPDRELDDPVQAMFEAFLRGEAPPLEHHDVAQLAATFEVVQWFEGLDIKLGSPLPDAETIRTRTDYLTLLLPFEQLAGANFAGRASELGKLRDYVGVVAPRRFGGRVYRAVRRVTEEVFSLTEKPLLFIDGPGGVGKSALISRFIWEHTTDPDEQFPFVYLDFDRARLQPDEPLTLLIEAVRQIGLQYKEARPYAARVQAQWQAQLLERYARATTGTTNPPLDLRGHVLDLGSLLYNVREGRDPCLFVLDTFEEVQYRGDVVVASLCRFLETLQAAVPRLRIVAAGRVELSVPNFPVTRLTLGDFDADAAKSFLAARGVANERTVRAILKHVGRNPLSLSLAAKVVESARQRGGTENFDRLGTNEAQIQGQLYRRILMHIKDDEVQRVAYPGLALRRVTPAIIREVLATPCGVSVPDDETAQDLFDRLAREASLVTHDNGALVHRRDVRRLMLPLLRSAEAGSVGQIEEAAIAYYEGREDPAERAEEIYHRLARHQPLDVVATRWTDDVKPYLFNTLDENELGARERAWLLQRLDPTRQLSDEEREAADLETWEWDTLDAVRDLVAHDRLNAALEALQARPERSPGSPLYAVEADVLKRLDRWVQALEVVRVGIDSAREKGDVGLLVELQISAAGIAFRIREFESMEALLDDAEQLLSSRPDDRVRALHLGLLRLQLARRRGGDPATTAALARSRLAKLSDALLIRNRELAAKAATELGPESPEVFERVLRVIGLPLRPRQLRALASTIAHWDDDTSRATNRWKGVLGGAALPWAETLTKAWTQHLSDLSASDLGTRVARLLTQAQPPDALLHDLERAMLEQAGELAETGETPEASTKSSPTTVTPPPNDALYPSAQLRRLNGKEMKLLVNALVDAFPSRAELTMLLRMRLHRSLDSIAFDGPLATIVMQLVQAAEMDDWVSALVAAALDSRPGNAALRAAAEEVGLIAPSPVRELERSASGIEPDRWRSLLGVREVQVCRIALPDDSFGTGFLVGPEFVLTAGHVMHRVVGGELPPSLVTLAFDFRRLSDGQVAHGITSYLLATDWLVAYSPPSVLGTDGLDYALLRLQGTPGNDPVGGDAAEPGAAARGWIAPRQRSYDLPTDGALAVLSHDREGNLKVAVDVNGIVGFDAATGRVRYLTKVELHSAGAPCFDLNWELVALHQRRDPSGVNEGVALSAILRELEATGVAEALYRAPV